MKNKNQRLIELFETHFGKGKWPDNGVKKKCEFKCIHSEDCKVESSSPRYTGALGSKDTDVMLIAEAPSSAEGIGSYFGGNIKDSLAISTKSDGLNNLISFIEKGQKTTPYFTDVIKCGVPKQNNKSGLSKNRKNNCIKYFLDKEIEIINPRIIFCIGKTAFNVINKINLSKKYEVINLIHYSRQANMHLSISDKKKIWEIQSGIVNENEFDNVILNLECITNLKKTTHNSGL